MQKVFKTAARIVQSLQEYIVMVTGLLSCVLIVIGAFMRYVLSMDFYGSEEMILMAAFWLYFIGSSLASRDDTHINADMLSTMLKSPRSKNILAVIRFGLSFAISLLATVWSYNYVKWSFSMSPTTPVLKWPMTWMQMPILVSFVLSDCYILGHLITSIKHLIHKEELS